MARDPVPVPGAPAPGPRPRKREGGFTPEKRQAFLAALKTSGCIADAARAAGISRHMVRRHRGRCPDFASQVESALAIASVDQDVTAWQRATAGAQEKVHRDGRRVFARVESSDATLRMLLEGAPPERRGQAGQMPKAAVMKQLRQEAEAEAKAKFKATEEETKAAILKKLDVIRRRRLREGYSEGPGGMLVPPGWRVVPDADADGD